MLSDLLGVLVGFATIMLFLSLIVTAMVQATIAMVGLRVRNLQTGLEEALRSGGIPPQVGSTTRAALAKQILVESAMPIGTTPRHDVAEKPRRFSPMPTWLDPDDVPDLVSHALGAAHAKQPGVGAALLGNVDAAAIGKDVQTAFTRVHAYMNKRFASYVRLVTIAWAVLVAGAFQVSAPDLVKHLYQDAGYRTQVAAAGQTYVETHAAPAATPVSLEVAAHDAVADVIAVYPDLEQRLEDLNADADNIDGVEAELATLLKGYDQVDAVVRLHRAATQRHLQALYQQSLDAAGASTDQLGALNITLWPHHWSFYRCGGDALKNSLGVLITVIFLTFGAPFWYEQLKNLASLRDVMSDKDAKKATK